MAQAILSWFKKKEILKAVKASKKARYFDNFAIATALILVYCQNIWFIQKKKPTAII